MGRSGDGLTGPSSWRAEARATVQTVRDLAMTLYDISRYLHVVAAMSLLLTFGLEWIGVVRLREAATAEQARAWFSVLAAGRSIGPATLAAIVLPGLYMAWEVWGFVGWIDVALGAVALMAALGAHNGIRLANIGKEVGNATGPLPAPLVARLRNPLFLVSLRSRLGIILGTVYLMTSKPDVLGSLLTIGIALAAGLAWALPAWTWGRQEERPA
jgi:hypothetical protein